MYFIYAHLYKHYSTRYDHVIQTKKNSQNSDNEMQITIKDNLFKTS